MSVFRGEEHRFKDEFINSDDKELTTIGRECRPGDRSVSPRSHMEQEKRIRREIANSNERRRMQSINAGFQSLRTLLPSHEGEKLSKAAILQQTAEYIYQLEQEKTRLLSQNCQLKRLVNQQDGENATSIPIAVAKKRKLESAFICESIDEGIGSMSPEPVMGNPLMTATIANNMAFDGEPGNEMLRRDMIDLRLQLERERRLRMHLEEKVRCLESQMYPNDRLREMAQHVQLTYQSHEGIQVIDHGGNHNCNQPALIEETVVEEMEVPMPIAESEEIIHSPVNMNDLLSSAVLPPVVQTQTISTTTLDEISTHIRCKKEPLEDKCTIQSPSPPPTRLVLRLPSVIEAAIKAEPKVEVERLPTQLSGNDTVPPSITSRQSLETIVEAIRHLEGDHLFNDIPSPPCHKLQLLEEPVQEVPLALTTKHQTPQRLIKVDMNPFLKFHTTQSLSQNSALQQQRPGVIVVKHTPLTIVPSLDQEELVMTEYEEAFEALAASQKSAQILDHLSSWMKILQSADTSDTPTDGTGDVPE